MSLENLLEASLAFERMIRDQGSGVTTLCFPGLPAASLGQSPAQIARSLLYAQRIQATSHLLIPLNLLRLIPY